MELTLEQRIRVRAYEIWNSQGCTEGKADEHWLAAERELMSSQTALSVGPPASTHFAVVQAAPPKEKRGHGRRASAAKAMRMPTLRVPAS